MPSATRVPSGEALHASWYSKIRTGRKAGRSDSGSKQPICVELLPSLGETIPANGAERAAGAGATRKHTPDAPTTAARGTRLTGGGPSS